MELWGSFRVGRRAAARAIDAPDLAPLCCAGVLPEMRTARWIGLWPGQGMLVCDLGERARFLLAQHVPTEVLVGQLARNEGRHWTRYGIAEQSIALTARAEAGRSAVWFGWGAKPELPPLNHVFDALRNAP
jgi:hypothetical protein